MTGSTDALTWAPLVIPLLAACVVGFVPHRWLSNLKRHWLYLTALLLMAVAAWALGLVSKSAPPAVVADRTAFGRFPSLAWDDLAVFFALLSSGAHVGVGLTNQAHLERRAQVVARLLLAAATCAAFAAADLYTLCLAWGLAELTLFGLRAIEATPGHGRWTAWNTWAGWTSIALLVAAALLVPEGEGQGGWQAALGGNLSSTLLLLAVIVRIGVPPLSGHVLRHQETFLVSLWMGAALWLRLVANPAALPASRYLAPVGGGLMLAVGLMAVLAPHVEAALPYAVANSVAIAVLAPLISPQEGAAVALLAVINATLMVALLGAREQLLPFTPLGRWTRIPEGIALASWVGMPLTLGFLIHWVFLRISLQASLSSLVFCSSVSFLLSAAPAWRGALALFGSDETPPVEAHWSRWVGISSAGALALAALVVGVAPGVLSWVGVGPVAVLGPGQSAGGGADQFGSLVYLALLGPLVGGLSLQYLLRDLPHAAKHWLNLIRGVLLLDWLVLLLEEGLTRLEQHADRILSAVEGGFYLGWSLIWGLVILFFLFGGRV